MNMVDGADEIVYGRTLSEFVNGQGVGMGVRRDPFSLEADQKAD